MNKAVKDIFITMFEKFNIGSIRWVVLNDGSIDFITNGLVYVISDYKSQSACFFESRDDYADTCDLAETNIHFISKEATLLYLQTGDTSKSIKSVSKIYELDPLIRLDKTNELEALKLYLKNDIDRDTFDSMISKIQMGNTIDDFEW